MQGRGLAVALVVGMVSLIGAAPSWAHGDGSQHRGLSERELRAAEESVLGADHAAEHARVRKFERRAEGALAPAIPRTAPPCARATQACPHASRRARVAGRPCLGRAVERPGRASRGRRPRRAPADRQGHVLQPDQCRHVGERSGAYLWDPSTNAMNAVHPPIDPRTGRPVNLFCAGQSLLADGQLLVTGGNLAYDPDLTPDDTYKGLNKIYTFDPWTRDLDRAAAHGEGSLVPDADAARRRAHADHLRS